MTDEEADAIIRAFREEAGIPCQSSAYALSMHDLPLVIAAIIKALEALEVEEFRARFRDAAAESGIPVIEEGT